MPTVEPPPSGGGEGEGMIPEQVEAKLTDLLDLVARAMDAWQHQDKRGALDAVSAAMPVAEAAAAELTVLGRLDIAERERLAREEEERRRRTANPHDWLG